jgi:hypothetical protein
MAELRTKKVDVFSAITDRPLLFLVYCMVRIGACDQTTEPALIAATSNVQVRIGTEIAPPTPSAPAKQLENF